MSRSAQHSVSSRMARTPEEFLVQSTVSSPQFDAASKAANFAAAMTGRGKRKKAPWESDATVRA